SHERSEVLSRRFSRSGFAQNSQLLAPAVPLHERVAVAERRLALFAGPADAKRDLELFPFRQPRAYVRIEVRRQSLRHRRDVRVGVVDFVAVAHRRTRRYATGAGMGIL